MQVRDTIAPGYRLIPFKSPGLPVPLSAPKVEKTLFDSFKAFWGSKSLSQQLLAGGAIASLAMTPFADSESGFFKKALNFALNIAGIATLFNPALIFPVALLYIGRGILTAANGNLITGLMDIACAIPIWNLYKKWGELMKDGFQFVKFIKDATKVCYGNQAVKQVRYVMNAATNPKNAYYKGVEGLAQGFNKTKATWQRAVAEAA